MSLSRFVVGVLLVGVMVPGAGVVSAQDFPNRPIRILTSAAGGNSDFAARTIAQGLADSMGQQVIVDNRGGQTIPAEIVQKSPPDGYSILLDGGSFWIAPLMVATPYDVVKDYAPITVVTSSPGLLVVHPSVAANSVKELIALARAKPGALNYASGGTGSSSHLALELFKAMAGLNVVRINYKGTANGVNAVLAGEVQMMIPAAAGVAQHVQSGKLKVLAVSGAQRSPAYPQFPSIAEAGLPGYEASSFQGLFAPAKTPAAVINRLNQETARILTRADVKERFLKTGVDAIVSSPQQFGATVNGEIAKWSKVIKDAGIKAE